MAPHFDYFSKNKTLSTLRSVSVHTQEEFFFASTNHYEIFKTIQSLKSNASGTDNINAKLLKVSAEVIYPIVLTL